ncbi:MAG: hypothetical protein IRZ21_06190 [Thermoleophilaceae bacterium]|nr:hypothetical protein [Thermoleophilaceae bacterium]
MTADGRTIVFQTPDPLVTEDTNFAPGTFSPQGWDVYEWHDGTLSLLTDGTTPSTSSSDNVFTNITPDGRDVFLYSFDKLAPQEISHTGAIYDARIGGGFPVPTPPAECRDDGCQGPASPQPELPVPASVSFAGPGDVSAAGTPTFRVARISGSAQRRLARTGRITLSVRVPDEGTVEATASARVKGLLARVARASRHASRASTVHVTLKLSTAARRELARRHRLTVRFVVRFSELPGSATATVTLRQARSSANARHTATRKGR